MTIKLRQNIHRIQEYGKNVKIEEFIKEIT